MITLYDTAGGCLVMRRNSARVDGNTLWIDLLNPTTEEESEIEKVLGIDVPTRAEMREIEQSNRFYSDTGAQFMTVFVISSDEKDAVITSNITFILLADRLITVRYSEPRAFTIFAERACKNADGCNNGAQIMMSLIEALIQRQADLIEKLQDGIEGLAPQIFSNNGAEKNSSRRLEVLLKVVGKQGDTTSRAQEAATSLHRTLLYFTDAARQRGEDAKLMSRIESADRDILSLAEHLRFVSGRTSFLLDATLGMIATEQNQIIKLFSVMAVMLMPPTLVASIYGMNFKHMPELEWLQGYPFALALMFISGLIPYLYFRRKGWL